MHIKYAEKPRGVMLRLCLKAAASMIVGLCEVMLVLVAVALGEKVGSYRRIWKVNLIY